MKERDLLKLMEFLAIHLSERRDALEVISTYGNRFEDWLKWECAICYCMMWNTNIARSIFKSVVVEMPDGIVDRRHCDLFLGQNDWPDDDSTETYPTLSDGDVWLELKARNTYEWDKSDLVKGINEDIIRQQERKNAGYKELFLVGALIVDYPGKNAVRLWNERMMDAFNDQAELITKHLLYQAALSKEQESDHPFSSFLVWKV